MACRRGLARRRDRGRGATSTTSRRSSSRSRARRSRGSPRSRAPSPRPSWRTFSRRSTSPSALLPPGVPASRDRAFRLGAPGTRLLGTGRPAPHRLDLPIPALFDAAPVFDEILLEPAELLLRLGIRQRLLPLRPVQDLALGEARLVGLPDGRDPPLLLVRQRRRGGLAALTVALAQLLQGDLVGALRCVVGHVPPFTL